ncbi:SH3 domain-containing protein [Xanthobacter sp. V3C-3]|uniref:SH3 domain-containing protein n=1 Tax=Xanthobacter lutulentifluminis TaxID=3119935 RepID=UPI00372AB6DD
MVTGIGSKMRMAVAALALAAGVGFGGTAQAAEAVAVSNVNLRAGPSTSFPVVVQVQAGSGLTTHGCLADYSWCDVGVGGMRGWMAAQYIQVIQSPGASPVVMTAAVAAGLGIAAVAFNQSYWNTHYVGRPWYGQWNRYYGPYARGPVGHAGATRCYNGACRHVGVTRGPAGNTVVRRGVVVR